MTKKIALVSLVQGLSFTAMTWCAWPLSSGRFAGVCALAFLYAVASSYSTGLTSR